MPHAGATAADSISLALANLRLRELLQAMSVRDHLTGLYNRRFMEEALVREISRMTRARKFPTVAMLDIDHFQTVQRQLRPRCRATPGAPMSLR